MKVRIWLTGFEPFGKYEVNPSQIISQTLIGSTRVVRIEPSEPFGLESEEMELTFEGAILSVDEAGSRFSTAHLDDIDAVIHIGLKESATQIHLEMCAVNETAFRIADNSGRQPLEGHVEAQGLALLHSTAHRPSFEIAHASSNEVVISEDAGRFVCNETYYRTLHSIETRGLDIPAIFIHIPTFEEMDVERQVEIILDVAARLAQKPTISVVGCVIVNPEGRMLACKRAAGEAMGGCWEFPGGKVDAGESEPEALIREMREELDLIVEVGRCLGRHRHDYGTMIVELAFFSCTADGQEPILTVHDQTRWITEGEIGDIEWLPPDVEFVEKLAEVGFSALRDRT